MIIVAATPALTSQIPKKAILRWKIYGKSMEIGKIWEKDGKIFNKWKNLGEIYGNLWKMCKKNRWEKYGKQWWET
jgi:hypothetical protein